MANECKTIEPKLLLYMNKRLSKDEVSEVVLHLATCESCRKELATVIQLKKELTKTVTKIPASVKVQVFNKIYIQEAEDVVKTEHLSRDLKELFSNTTLPPLNVGSKMLSLVMSPVKETIKLIDHYKGGQNYVRS